MTAIYADSIDHIFKIVGGFVAPAITFLLPGLSYLFALLRFGDPREVCKSPSTLFGSVAAVLFVLSYCTLTTFYLRSFRAAF